MITATIHLRNGRQRHYIQGMRNTYAEVFSHGFLTGLLVGSSIRIYLTPSTRAEATVEMLEALDNGSANELWYDWIASVEQGCGWITSSHADDFGNLSNAPVLVGPDGTYGLPDDEIFYSSDNGVFTYRGYPRAIDGFWFYSPYAIRFEGEDILRKGYVEYEFHSLREKGTVAHSTHELMTLIAAGVSGRNPAEVIFQAGSDQLSSLMDYLQLVPDMLEDLDADKANRMVWVRGGDEIWVQVTGTNSPFDSVYRKVYNASGADWFGRWNNQANHLIIKVGE